MSAPGCGYQYCLQVTGDFTFTFKGTTYSKGSSFGTDDPCEVLEWEAAAKDAYRVATGDTSTSLTVSVPGGMAAVREACRKRMERGNGPSTAPPAPGAPVTHDPEPVQGGTEGGVPGGEETAETLEAPDAPPIAEVGVDNPADLPDYAKSVEGVADPLEVLERIKKLREKMSEEEIEEAFRKNQPPEDEPHPDHSQPLNTEGLCAGDPVLLATGQFDLRVVDVELPSVGFALRFERVHRSGPRFFGPFGFNWDHGYNQSLRLLSRDRVAHWTGALQEHVYEPGEGGALEPPVGVHRRLRRVSGSGEPERWELEEALGFKWTFAALPDALDPSRLPLVRLEDRHGNAHVLDYDAQGRLVRVRDGWGRALTLHYGECELLEGVEDHSGRRWSYLHDEAAEHLVAVRTPPVDGAPSGLQTEYTYDDGHPDPNLRHGITRIFDGERVQVENQYGRELGWDYGKVVLQRLAGVAISYTYAQVQDVLPAPENVDAPAGRTEVRREGEGLRVYTFNFRGELLDERLRLLEDGTARVLAYAYRYDPAGNLALRMEPDGLSALFEYDHAAPDPRARGNLLRTSLRPSPLTPGPTRVMSQCRYEPRYQLRTEARDESGALTRFVYDFDVAPGGTGTLVRVEHPPATLADGQVQHAVERYVCNATGRWTEHVTAAGHRHVRRYHPDGAPGAGLLAEETFDADGTPVTTTFTYDAVGRVVQMEDGRGHATAFAYDAVDRLVRVTPPTVDGVAAEQRSHYDRSGLLVREEGPRGAYVDAALAGDALVTVHRYDGQGRRVETVLGVGASSERRFRFAYGPDGNLTALEDPLGRTRRFRYDERGLVLEEVAAAGAPDERRVQHRYDRSGRRVATLCAGREHRFEYDRYGRLTATITPDGTREEREYGPNDLLVRHRFVGRPAPGEDPRLLSETSYEHDERGRPRRTRELVFVDAPADGSVQTAELFPDADGRVVRTVDPTGATWRYAFTGTGAPASIVDPLGHRRLFSYDAAGNCERFTLEEQGAGGGVKSFTTRFTYDARNQRRTRVDPLGNVSRWSLDARGLVTSEVDPLGQEVRFAHGLEGELLSVERIDGSVVRAYGYTWDAGGRLQTMVDPAGQVTRLESSALDELTALVLPDGRRVERRYHPTGDLRSEHHADGRELRQTVSEAGLRQVWEALPGPGDVPVPSRVLERDGLGRLVRASMGAHVVSRRYDSLGRVVAERRGDSTVTYAYDDPGRSVLRTRSSGRAERLHFDALGRLERIVLETPAPDEPSWPAGFELCRYAYEGVGRVATRQDGNGVVDRRTYDWGGRLSTQDVRRAGGGEVAELRFLHDGLGRRVALGQRPAPLSDQVATYDGRSRLTALRKVGALPAFPEVASQTDADAVLAAVSTLPASAHERFTVSDADETLQRELADPSVGTETHAFVPGPFCRLVQADGRAVVYDGRGNLVDDGERAFAYDPFGRLARVTRKSDGTVLLALERDALGRVVTRTSPEGSASLAYEGATVVTELRSNGERVEWVPGIAAGETVCVSRDAQPFWLHQDTQRNLLAATDDSGTVVDRYAYSAFGIPDVASPGGAPRTAPVSGLEPVFGGHTYCSAAGVFLMGPRVYDPAFGRFLQPDPAWPRDGASPYTYAAHDPLNQTDPSGMCLPRPGASGMGGGGAGEGSGTGTGRGGSSGGKSGSGGSGGSSWGGNLGRGAGTLGWGLVLLGFAALVLSGPFGWAGALVGTMMLATGFAGVGAGIAQMAIAHTHSEEEDRVLDRGISTATSISSGPGSLIGATIAAGTGHDVERGALIGGLTEGGLSLGHALGKIAVAEYRFARMVKLGFAWEDPVLKVALRESMGPAAASAGRFNPLFRWKGRAIEWRELSHFFSRKLTRGFERLFNRPWNLTPLWATEHALVDPARWRFASPLFKAAYAGQTLHEAEFLGSRVLTQIVRRHRMAPGWMLGVERGGFQLLYGTLHGPEGEEEPEE